MKKNLFNKIILSFAFFSFFFIGIKSVNASSIILKPSKESVAIEEQFYIDVLLNTEKAAVNGVEGTINFNSDELTFIRAEDGKSMINLWVEKPKLTSPGSIKFSGIMTNSFDGVIDPFDTNNKLPGPIVRIVFQTLKKGMTTITANPFNVALSDGQGTITNTLGVSKNIEVQNIVNSSIYKDEKDVSPELDYQIVKDPSLYDNRYVLIFNAKDKASGIESVKIKEGGRDWVSIESPYLLKDQTRHSKIALQAKNFNGAAIFINIDGVPYDWQSIIPTAISVILIIIFLIFIIKKYVYKKIS